MHAPLQSAACPGPRMLPFCHILSTTPVESDPSRATRPPCGRSRAWRHLGGVVGVAAQLRALQRPEAQRKDHHGREQQQAALQREVLRHLLLFYAFQGFRDIDMTFLRILSREYLTDLLCCLIYRPCSNF